MKHLGAEKLRLGSLVWLALAAWIPMLCGIDPPTYGEEPKTSKRPISYNQDIRPILSNNCFQCHGPDSEQRQADLRLDLPEGVDLEELLARISSSDSDVAMPPPDSNKELTGEQVDLVRRWISEGGQYQQHWAFIPPQKTELPGIVDWSDHLVDQFVMQRLQEADLTPNGPADKRTLIRRLSLDLIGLPPTREEIRGFLEDDAPDAYQRLVDRLLESPHFGEHMARYWLDLVRFADTAGLHHDHYREMTPYRDWVIRAFNDDLPFDDFIVAQIAGDMVSNPTIDQQIASGFNRLHLIIDRGTALPEESFTRNVVDRVSSIGTAFLGLTLECAVCHDHKYDPIMQRDFYKLFAFFNNFDGEPETGGRNGLDFRRGLQPPYLELPTPEQANQRSILDQELADLTAEIKNVGSSTKTDAGASSEDAATRLSELKEKLAATEKARDALIEDIPATLVMKDREDIRPAHILIRGNYDQPGERVERGVPSFLPPLEIPTGVPTRLDLAEWLVDSKNPLTARVAVNRLWQQVFGIGLVKTSEDFGAQGEPPSHPELLDQLTIRFVESGWDVKSLLRFIVLSKTYQQSSSASRERFLADPRNRLLARGSRYRLDAEVIRDQVLSVTGLLNPVLYGKSVKPPQPAGLWKIVAMPNSYPRIHVPDTGGDIYRRSVYTFWKRALPPPQMTIFDAPTRESCVARRERTNTPLQALVLMNEEQYFSAALNYATQLYADETLTDDRRIEIAYESITARRSSAPTMAALKSALDEFRLDYQSDPASADAMLAAYPVNGRPASESMPADELAALTMVIHSLLNLDMSRNRE